MSFILSVRKSRPVRMSANLTLTDALVNNIANAARDWRIFRNREFEWKLVSMACTQNHVCRITLGNVIDPETEERMRPIAFT